MKQIICLVDGKEKEAISERLSSTRDLIFTEDISEFSSKITNSSTHVIALSRIDESNYEEIACVIKKHSDKNFYILDKNPRNVENYLFEILTSENILASPYSLSEIYRLC